MKKMNWCYFYITSLIIMFVSCNKYLEEKPNNQLYVPNTPEDLQALLDNNSIMNFESASALIEMISGNFYLNDEGWSFGSADEQGAYIWDDQYSQLYLAWSLPYRCVYVSNVVLDNLPKIKENTSPVVANNLEGSALFFRAYSYYNLLQLYSKPFSETANLDLGIVLKLTGSVTEGLSRGTVAQSYNQIIDDLVKAIELLPENSENKFRPCSAAASALLARTYLSMSDYSNAKKYSELTLQKRSALIDYNSLLPLMARPFPSFLSNPEILFASILTNTSFNLPTVVIIDSNLYKSYEDNDIRKSAFFVESLAAGPGTYRFRGSYYNLSTSTTFNGLATDEIFLILAECLIRQGRVAEGLEKLNTLLRNRYYLGTFQDLSTTNSEEALNWVLKERRKELLFRGVNWSDIRRLNLEGRNLSLTRTVNGKTYTLPPNDLRSVLLIPNEEIIRSGIQQNPR